MGAEASILDNCHLGKSYPAQPLHNYSLQPGETGDGQHISVFLQKRKKQPDAVKKYAKNLKLIRHPYVIQFIASGITASVPFLATERIVPLSVALMTIHREEIIAGCNNITQALAFLHDMLSAAHNNVCMSSVYVGRHGSWKLGNFEHMSKFAVTTAACLEKCRDCQEEMYIPPEEMADTFAPKPELLYSRDVYALGALVGQLLCNIVDDANIHKITSYAKLQLQHTDPQCRPRASAVIATNIFRNDFLDIAEYLTSLVTKSVDENRAFFNSLLPRLTVLPEEVVARRLIRPLLSRFVLHNPAASLTVVPHVLTPRGGKAAGSDRTTGLVSEQLFKKHVVPELIKIFTVRSLHIRLCLLQHFPRYIRHVPHDDIVEHIFPQLLLGLRDTSDQLVMASLNTLAVLVPLIGAEAVIGGPRFSFFETGQPQFMRHRNHAAYEDPPAKSSLSDIMSDVIPTSPSDLEMRQTDVALRRDEMSRQQADRRQRRESSRHGSSGSGTILAGNNNVAFDSETSIDIERNLGKYGAFDHLNSSNALWDMIRNTRIDHNGDDDYDDDESDTSSLSINNDFINASAKGYNVDSNQANGFNKGSKPLKLNNHKGHRKNDSETSELSNNSSAAANQIVESTATDFNSADDEHWPPVGVAESDKVAKERVQKTTAKGSVPSGGAGKNKFSKGKVTGNKTQGLGQEFDVKSITVTASLSPATHVDFFADMVPDLEAATTKTTPDESKNANSVTTSTDSVIMAKPPEEDYNGVVVMKSKSSLFQANNQEDLDGWEEEELDWGADF